MLIAILILACISYLIDVLKILDKGESNIGISGALLILLAWPVSIAWGIIMICVTVLFWIIGYLVNLHNDK